MAEFEIDGVMYATRKMAAITQFHVMRKLAPVVESIGNISDLAKGDIAAVAPLIRAIGAMPEDDCNYIFAKCLAVVSRGNVSPAGTTWTPIWSENANRLMYDDMDLSTMLQLTGRVIQESLANFMPALPSSSFVALKQG